jgi:hypothetical protein
LPVPAGLPGYDPGHAAHTVATLLDLAAVGVEYAIMRQAVLVPGRPDPHQLIESDPLAAIGKPLDGLGQRDVLLPIALIDDEKIIPRALHFSEEEPHSVSLTGRYTIAHAMDFCDRHR